MKKSTFCYVVVLFTTSVFVLQSVGYLSPSWFSRSYVVEKDTPTVMTDRRKLRIFDMRVDWPGRSQMKHMKDELKDTGPEEKRQSRTNSMGKDREKRRLVLGDVQANNKPKTDEPGLAVDNTLNRDKGLIAPGKQETQVRRPMQNQGLANTDTGVALPSIFDGEATPSSNDAKNGFLKMPSIGIGQDKREKNLNEEAKTDQTGKDEEMGSSIGLWGIPEPPNDGNKGGFQAHPQEETAESGLNPGGGFTDSKKIKQNSSPEEDFAQYHVTIGVGLWFACVCLSGNQTGKEKWCKVYWRKDQQNLDNEMVMLEMRIEASVAVGASLLAVLASWSAICSSDTAIKKLLVTMVLLVISGIGMLLPVSNAFQTHVKHNDAMTNNGLRSNPREEDSKLSAIWGLFLCGTGGVLAILTAFTIAVLSWKKSCGSREEKWYNFNHELDGVSTIKSEDVFTVPLKNYLNNADILSQKERNSEKNAETKT